MTAPRWLLVLVIATGLLAMHGITASAASAAAPCGAAVPHEHHGTPSSSDVPAAQQASDLEPLAGHAGALCLAVLVGGLVAGLLARRLPRGRHGRPGGSTAAGVAMTGRPPPESVRALLCVSRT